MGQADPGAPELVTDLAGGHRGVIEEVRDSFAERVADQSLELGGGVFGFWRSLPPTTAAAKFPAPSGRPPGRRSSPGWSPFVSGWPRPLRPPRWMASLACSRKWSAAGSWATYLSVELSSWPRWKGDRSSSGGQSSVRSRPARTRVVSMTCAAGRSSRLAEVAVTLLTLE